MQRLADVKFKIHNHNTTQKTRHSSLVFVLWTPHSKRVTVGTFLQTISLPLAEVPQITPLAGSDCGHGSSRRGRELSAARGGSQCSCGRRGSRLGLAILGDWERSFGFFWCFGCSFSAVAGRILPTSLWLWWLRWFWWSWWLWWLWWFDDYDDYDDYDYDHFDDYKHVSLTGLTYWTLLWRDWHFEPTKHFEAMGTCVVVCKANSRRSLGTPPWNLQRLRPRHFWWPVKRFSSRDLRMDMKVGDLLDLPPTQGSSQPPGWLHVLGSGIPSS